MNKFLFIAFSCLLSHFCTAQLNVTNSAYLYAENVPLYVKEEVNLKDSNSKLYLRDDAQLLQDSLSSTSYNTGVGQLSLYQTGTVDNFEYNYWCSPVGNTDNTDSNNRNFRGNNQLYEEITAPITSSAATFTTGLNGSSSPLTISSRWIYTFESNTTYSSWVAKGSTGEIDPGYGFTMKGTSGSSDAQLYDFRGKPNNGNIEVNVDTNKFTLAGNPYPSAMDIRAYLHDSDNSTRIEPYIYIWEQDKSVNSHYLKKYQGGYASYTITDLSTTPIVETFVPASFNTYKADGTLNANGSSTASSKRIRRYIPSGQGFMIVGKSNTTAIAKNAHRIHYKQSDSDSEFFKTIENAPKTKTVGGITYKDGKQILPKEFKRFRINIDFNNIYSRQLLHNFHKTATTDFDAGLEIPRRGGPKTDAYWLNKDVKYNAQALAFNKNLKIPFTINCEEDTPVRVRIAEVENFNKKQPIFVHDKETDIYYDLKSTSFSTNLKKGTYPDRFEIVFKDNKKNNKDSVDLDKNQAINIIQGNITNILTVLNPEEKSIVSAKVIDNLGKTVLNKTLNSNNREQQLRLDFVSDASYIVILKFADNSSFTKKVIIKN